MLKKLNAAMDYIEAHLEEDFRLEEVAAGVGISDLSFRQLFYALTGMTLQEYVKNRRLSEASGALLRGCSVTDTAYRYGYQSVDGFTRHSGGGADCCRPKRPAPGRDGHSSG